MRAGSNGAGTERGSGSRASWARASTRSCACTAAPAPRTITSRRSSGWPRTAGPSSSTTSSAVAAPTGRTRSTGACRSSSTSWRRSGSSSGSNAFICSARRGEGCWRSSTRSPASVGLTSLVLSSTLASAAEWEAEVTTTPQRATAGCRSRCSTSTSAPAPTTAPEYEAAEAVFNERHFYRGTTYPPEIEKMLPERGRETYVAMWGPNEWTLTGALQGLGRPPATPRARPARARHPRPVRPLDGVDRRRRS